MRFLPLPHFFHCKLTSSASRAYIHPFEGDDLIKGHASLISELQTQLRSAGVEQPPDAVICSVGGGGLLCGLLHGMDRDGWENGACPPA